MSHVATKWAFDQPEIHPDMKPAEWAVLIVLADCHNPVNGCFPSQDFISRKTNIKERSVRDQLARLRERGLIDWDEARDGNRRGSNRYFLAFEDGFQPANFAGRESASSPVSGGKSERFEPANSDSFNRQNLPPNPVIEPVREPSPPTPQEETSPAEPPQMGVVGDDLSDQEKARGEEARSPDGDQARGEEGRRPDREAKINELSGDQRKRLLAAWNHWDGKLGGSEDFLVREAVKLTVAEFDRGVDHARIDAYRKVEKARKLEPLKLYFAYLKNRKFDVEAIEERLEADTAAPPALAAPFGKRWMAMRLAELERQEAAGRAVWRATSFQRAMAAQPDKAHIVADDRRRGEFPLVARMDEHAGNGRSWPLTPDLPPSEHFVQIAADSDECRAWAGWHAARDWPWPSLPAWADYIWVPSRLPPALPEDVLSETGVL
ncbi:MAG: helix-turn-helix domain-containing protein [Nitratireductor sp.]|nr:helix-turn-helix domain-containing protein [Nitratireductor sp.]